VNDQEQCPKKGCAFFSKKPLQTIKTRIVVESKNAPVLPKLGNIETCWAFWKAQKPSYPYHQSLQEVCHSIKRYRPKCL